MSMGNSDALLAMVVLAEPMSLDLAAIRESMQRRDGQLTLTADSAGAAGSGDQAATFKVDGADFVLAMMPAPIPWNDLEGPCRTAWWWPQASEAIKPHKAHVVVAMKRVEGNALKQHILLSRIVAAVADATEAIGVYWGGGTVVHERAAFIEQCDEMVDGAFAPELWIDMRLARNEDGTIEFFTTGMEAFGRKEIEVSHARQEPDDILQFCYSVISHLISSNAEIGDGETVGRSEHEKVEAVYRPSQLNRTQQVLALNFE